LLNIWKKNYLQLRFIFILVVMGKRTEFSTWIKILSFVEMYLMQFI